VVDYFDNGKVTKEFVVEDIKKYNQRWPGRRYWVDGEPKVEMVVSARDIAPAVLLHTDLSCKTAKKTIWGSCENVISIRDDSTNPKVMSVRSKFLSRHENPAMGSWQRLRDRHDASSLNLEPFRTPYQRSPGDD
jgi:hypothetical protein